MNFKDFVNKIDEIYDELKRRKLLTHNSVAYNPENWKVKILTVPKSGYFGTFCVNVKDINEIKIDDLADAYFLSRFEFGV